MDKSIIITGASAVGKTTLQADILRAMPNYRKGLDFTTREPRSGEVNGQDRFFITIHEFIKLFDRGFFLEPDLEYAKYNNAYYGTPFEIGSPDPLKVSVIPALNSAIKLKKYFPESIWVHLYTNKNVLVDRLIKRGVDESEIKYRTDISNSDPGTFGELNLADLNFNTATFPTESIVGILKGFLNTFEQ